MIITECQLPAKAGYVEDEIDGVRVYVETEQHRKDREQQEKLQTLSVYCDNLLISMLG